MHAYRTEHDALGVRELPAEALYGIHALRAKENFPDGSRFPIEWYKATGRIKEAYYLAAERYFQLLKEEGLEDRLPQPPPRPEVLPALAAASRRVAAGEHFGHFIVPGISGGAGTSINLNVCEIITNVALVGMGHKPGNYDLIDPILHANLFQSTNDVVPSALRLAIMLRLRDLEAEVNDLRSGLEKKEEALRGELRMGYTQLQAAVPTSWGKLLGTYSEALSRDWWRISRCAERIKVVNLGGGAVGTGLSIPRYVIMEVTRQLQQLTGLALTRSENLPDATSNLDSLVEVHAMLKALAVNLEKMASDLRLLASDLTGQGLRLPAVQAGSSIMPGKVNPVIPEFIISAAHRVYANDGLITRLSGQGALELNAYLPVIGFALLESIGLLEAALRTALEKMVRQMSLETQQGLDDLLRHPSLATALIPYIGYHKAGELASRMKEHREDIFAACRATGLMTDEALRGALGTENILGLGYGLREREDA